MRINLPARYAAMGLVFGALACAGNTARTDDETGAAVDTTATDDTTATEDTIQNPPGYRGMERDTTQVPPGQTPTDTFLEQQGTGAPQDTAGYGGLEQVDTSARHEGPSDTTGYGQPGADTTGYGQPGVDTTSYGQPGTDTTGYGQPADTTQLQPDSAQGNTGAGLDTSGMSQPGDTTGYDQSQHQQHGDSTGQLQDSTSP